MIKDQRARRKGSLIFVLCSNSRLSFVLGTSPFIGKDFDIELKVTPHYTLETDYCFFLIKVGIRFTTLRESLFLSRYIFVVKEITPYIKVMLINDEG